MALFVCGDHQIGQLISMKRISVVERSIGDRLRLLFEASLKKADENLIVDWCVQLRCVSAPAVRSWNE